MKHGIIKVGLMISVLNWTVSASIPKNSSTVFDPSPFATLKNQVACNFDHGTSCRWSSVPSAALLFKLNTGSTPTDGTGPDSDHTHGQGGSGAYLYLESSAPAKLDETAVLASHDLLPGNEDYTCFSFWYHMSGASVGTLHVYQVHKANTTLFRTNGDHGSGWHQAKVTVNPPGPLALVMEATVGDGYQGDIALDDLSLTDGQC